MERMIGCLVLWKCFVACLFFEESQHPTCPHSMHSRRCTQVSPIFTQSWQTCTSVLLNLISFQCAQRVVMMPSDEAPAAASGDRSSPDESHAPATVPASYARCRLSR